MINWNFNDNLKDALESNMNCSKEIKKALNKKYNVKKGDRVCLVYNDGKPTKITTKISGNTLKSILTSIDKGMRRPLKNVNYDPSTGISVESIYNIISGFVNPEDRIRLINAFEYGELTPVQLIGDHKFFEDGLRRERNGVWTYGSGS